MYDRMGQYDKYKKQTDLKVAQDVISRMGGGTMEYNNYMRELETAKKLEEEHQRGMARINAYRKQEEDKQKQRER